MSLLRIEADLNNNLQSFVESFVSVFDRVVHYEVSLREGAVETPAAIDEAMKELVALYSTLNTATALLQAKITIHEAKEYIQFKDQSNGIKTTERYINSQVDIKSEHYHRACAIFQSCRDNCDRMISVLQSSLKAVERDFALTKHT